MPAALPGMDDETARMGGVGVGVGVGVGQGLDIGAIVHAGLGVGWI